MWALLPRNGAEQSRAAQCPCVHRIPTRGWCRGYLGACCLCSAATVALSPWHNHVLFSGSLKVNSGGGRGEMNGSHSAAGRANLGGLAGKGENLDTAGASGVAPGLMGRWGSSAPRVTNELHFSNPSLTEHGSKPHAAQCRP